jgi:pyridoxamine 5'-phosphate oxidase
MVLPEDTNITPRRYPTETLSEDFVNTIPSTHFKNWFDEALKKEVAEPDAFTLSTFDSKRVNARTVALRGFEQGDDQKGYFYFYTNYHSAKAREIEKNSNVALTFYWPQIFRQIRVLGSAKKCSSSQSDKYFATRPRGSQIGAWTSRQDEELQSREELLDHYIKFEKELGEHIERPPFWGGFVIEANEYEFMQGFESRLHDRFKYVYDDKFKRFYGKRLWP